MAEKVNQHFPFAFDGAADDPVVYAKLKAADLAAAAAGVDGAATYFPPPESQGGWRKLDEPDDIRRLAGMDPDKLDELRRVAARIRRSRLRRRRHPPRLHRAGGRAGQQREDRRAAASPRSRRPSAPRCWPSPRSRASRA